MKPRAASSFSLLGGGLGLEPVRPVRPAWTSCLDHLRNSRSCCLAISNCCVGRPGLLVLV